MTNCCGPDLKSYCDQFDCKVKETDKGIQIEVSPKDPKKANSFKDLVKACKDFCECC